MKEALQNIRQSADALIAQADELVRDYKAGHDGWL